MSGRERLVRALLAGKPGGPHPGGIHVYHSSPHDFDRFDWNKLRTGEGANVYGSGFYFAENPKVSGQGGVYWDQFSRRFSGPEKQAADFLASNNFNRQAAIDFARHQRAGKDVLDILESGAPVGPRTYEVNINARPELMLDWDKPLHAQPHMVDPLNKAGFNLSPAVGDLSYLTQKAAEAGPDSWYAAQLRAVGDMRNKTGAEFMPRTTEDAERLRDAGIPGIRYLDQGSRNAGDWHLTPPNQTVSGKWMVKSNDYNSKGLHFDTEDAARTALAEKQGQQTYNYVVTDPSKLDILAKYGVVPTAGGGLSALAAQDQYGAQQ